MVSTHLSPHPIRIQRSVTPEMPAVEAIIRAICMSDLLVAEQNVAKAQDNQQRQANQHRSDVRYRGGTAGWLSTADLRLKMKITPKLTQRWIGPFPIKRKLSPLTYELDLPLHSLHSSCLSYLQTPPPSCQRAIRSPSLLPSLLVLLLHSLNKRRI